MALNNIAIYVIFLPFTLVPFPGGMDIPLEAAGAIPEVITHFYIQKLWSLGLVMGRDVADSVL